MECGFILNTTIEMDEITPNGGISLTSGVWNEIRERSLFRNMNFTMDITSRFNTCDVN